MIMATDNIAARQGKQSQKFIGCSNPVDSERLMVHLTAQVKTGTAPWVKLLSPAWEKGKEGKEHTDQRKVCLRCNACGNLSLATHPNQTAKRHLERCTAQTKAASVSKDTDMEAIETLVLTSQRSATTTVASTPKSSGGLKRSATDSTQLTLDSMVNHVTASTKEGLVKDLAYFFFTSDTPMRCIENEHLVHAYQRLNIKLPCQKSLRTTWLDTCHAEVKATCERSLSQMQVRLFVS
jgi:hypothetical protein